MERIIHSHRALLTVAWTVAIGFIVVQGFYFYYSFMPVHHWLKYDSVTPLNDEVCVNDTLKFVTLSNVYRPVPLRFNDILYCKDRDSGTYERYNEQNTRRSATTPGLNRLTVWPFNPGVAYPTECYLESNITLKFPMNVSRSFRYDGLENGKTLVVKDCQ